MSLVVGALALLSGASAASAAQQPGGATTPAAGAIASAQPDRALDADTPDATRGELTALLQQSLERASDGRLSAKDRARAQQDANRIRQRLELGDFQPGDRFMLTLVLDSARNMDVVVREGPAIEFGALPELPVAGILRAELEPAIVKHLSKFYRNPTVRLQFLTRISILGAVGKPGSYSVAPFAPIADVVNQAAGGLLQNAVVDKITIRRDGREVVSSKAYREAIKNGATVLSLGLQPGDEIRVPAKQPRNWTGAATVLMFGLTAFATVLALVRSAYAE